VKDELTYLSRVILLAIIRKWYWRMKGYLKGIRGKVMVGAYYYPKIMPNGRTHPREWDAPIGIIVFIEGDTTIEEVKHKILKWKEQGVCTFDVWFFSESIHKMHELIESLPYNLKRRVHLMNAHEIWLKEGMRNIPLISFRCERLPETADEMLEEWLYVTEVECFLESSKRWPLVDLNSLTKKKCEHAKKREIAESKGRKAVAQGIAAQREVVEEFLAKDLRVKYSFKRGEPDIVVLDEHDRIIEVVAVKAYWLEITDKPGCRNVKGHKYAVSFNPLRDAKAESKTAMENGLDHIRLIVINLKTGNRIFDGPVRLDETVTIREYSPDYQPNPCHRSKRPKRQELSD